MRYLLSKTLFVFLTRECEGNERVIAFGGQISLARSMGCRPLIIQGMAKEHNKAELVKNTFFIFQQK